MNGRCRTCWRNWCRSNGGDNAGRSTTFTTNDFGAIILTAAQSGDAARPGEIAMTVKKIFTALFAALGLFTIAGCNEPKPGTVQDEALRAGRTADSFPAAAEDYFADMDGGYRRDSDPNVKLNVNEVRGRNSWIVWTGGNDRFWDYLSNNSFGAFDLLKIMSSNPRIGFCLNPK